MYELWKVKKDSLVCINKYVEGMLLTCVTVYGYRISGIVNGLEQRGFIDMQCNNRRIVLMSITPADEIIKYVLTLIGKEV
jgi:hypothetical protein